MGTSIMKVTDKIVTDVLYDGGKHSMKDKEDYIILPTYSGKRHGMLFDGTKLYKIKLERIPLTNHFILVIADFEGVKRFPFAVNITVFSDKGSNNIIADCPIYIENGKGFFHLNCYFPGEYILQVNGGDKKYEILHKRVRLYPSKLL